MDSIISTFIDHKCIVPVAWIFGDDPCRNFWIISVFLIKIIKFFQPGKFCLILDQDIILFGKTVDLIFKFLVFLKYVLLITKTVFYISEHITDTGNALFKGNNQKSGHILQRC